MHFESILASFWDHFGIILVPLARRCKRTRKSSPSGLHFEASWSQLERRWEPRWRQDGQLGAQDGQLGAQDSQFGSILGAILARLRHLGANFIENAENAKTLRKLKVFKGFWVVWGVHLESFGGHFGLCWRILALRASILSELGSMIPHLDDKMRPKSANTSQHEQNAFFEKTWKKTGHEKQLKTNGFFMFCVF